MSGEPTTVLCGNLTSPPELRFTPSGAAVINFTVAQTPRVFDKQAGEYRDGDTLFMRCNLWRQQAENLAETDLKAGSRVMVMGRLRQRSFDHKGEKRTVVELEVDEVGPSLKYATAKINRVGRQGGSETGGNAPSDAPSDDPWGQPPPAPAGASAATEEPPF